VWFTSPLLSWDALNKIVEIAGVVSICTSTMPTTFFKPVQTAQGPKKQQTETDMIVNCCLTAVNA
jgi:hypothetical protein